MEIDKDRISDVKVLRSAAGFYIGRTYREAPGYEVPYDRQRGYWSTRGPAEEALKTGMYGL